MKKTQMALAAVALVASSAAMAQVTVYGNADGSIITGGGTTAFDGGGGYTTSLLGVRGSEDLGGGLKASFNLESAVNLGNGGQGGGAGGNTGLFNRAANVSLGNDMVGVTLGNQLSIAVADALTGATAGAGDNVNVPAIVRVLPLPGTVLHGGGSASTALPIQVGDKNSGFFIPDAVTLRASAAGLTFKAQTRVNKTDATNSGYTAFTLSGGLEGFNFAVGQQQSSGIVATGSAAEYKTMFVAANTKIGDLGLNGTFANNTGLVSARTYMFGASYPLSDALSVGAIYAKGSTANGNQTSFNLKYSLSKSTVAYVTTSMFSIAGANGNYSNTNNAGITGGKNVTAIGISHSF
jgi:predicted porin